MLLTSAHVSEEDRARARKTLAAQREARVARRDEAVAARVRGGGNWLSDDEDEGEEDVLATRSKAAQAVRAYHETPRGGSGGRDGAGFSAGDEPYALAGHADHLGHVKDAMQRQRRGTGDGGGGGSGVAPSTQPPPPRRRPSYTGGPGGMMSPLVRARGAGFGFPAPPQGAAPCAASRPTPSQPPPQQQQQPRAQPPQQQKQQQQQFSTMEYK